MDLYLDFDHNSGRRRRGRRRGRRNRSRVPFVIGVIILLVVIVAGGIFAGRKYMAYRQQKAEEARKLAEARRVVTVMIPEGYSIDMIAKRLEKQGVFKADEFIKKYNSQEETLFKFSVLLSGITSLIGGIIPLKRKNPYPHCNSPLFCVYL